MSVFSLGLSLGGVYAMASGLLVMLWGVLMTVFLIRHRPILAGSPAFSRQQENTESLNNPK